MTRETKKEEPGVGKDWWRKNCEALRWFVKVLALDSVLFFESECFRGGCGASVGR